VQVDKYYLDAVAPDGSGCIGYAARLEGLGLGATAACLLQWDAAPAPKLSRRRTLRGTMPVATGTGVTWQCGPLAVDGRWENAGPAGELQELWREGDGCVQWQVLAPRGQVALASGRGQVAGWGYAERLRLNVPPWRLPISTLHWGRFVSPTQSVVWIGWEQGEARRWLWHNGVAHHEFVLGASTLTWSGGNLELDQPRTLRSGLLAATALAGWPGLRRVVPARIQAWGETKWCRPALLEPAGQPAVTGWVIHEEVHMP